MLRKRTPAKKKGNLDKILAEARQNREVRSVDYRDRALKLFPWICARCGREFSGKKLSDLTVHHKDHDHDNNPPDGSNWELLCIYCHDMEHARYMNDEIYGEDAQESPVESSSMNRPFAALKDLIKDKK
jgi:hypothetical protein